MVIYSIKRGMQLKIDLYFAVIIQTSLYLFFIILALIKSDLSLIFNSISVSIPMLLMFIYMTIHKERIGIFSDLRSKDLNMKTRSN